MATRATVCSWDNSSRGLDASSALDYAKSIRVLTDIHQSSTFVSLYQAGEGIFEQFDKVLLIDEGRTVFFGPAREARAYMVRPMTSSCQKQRSPISAYVDVARIRRLTSVDFCRLPHGMYWFVKSPRLSCAAHSLPT